MTKKRIIELAVKVIVAALTAFLTALTTTSAWASDQWLCKETGVRRQETGDRKQETGEEG